jgi:hypothetical protein
MTAAPSSATSLSQAPPREKRRLVIEPGFQFRAQIPAVLSLAILALLTATAVFLPLHHRVTQEPDVGVRALLRQQLFDIHLRLWPLFLVAGLIGVYYGLYWSRRVAEPLHRLHLHLQGMAEGDLKPLDLRSSHEYRIFEEDVGVLNRKMHMLATRNRDVLLAVHGYVSKLRERLTAGDVIPRADLDENVTAILNQLEKTPDLAKPRR